jgi:uncharacterized protein
MSLQNKLSRFKKHLTVEKTETKTTKNNLDYDIPKSVSDIPFMEKWAKLNVKPHYYGEEFCLIRHVKYPLEHKHGLLDFSKLASIVSEWNQTTFDHPLSSKGRDASELLFFDTETTGLGGGVGNTIFLLGVAKVLDDYIDIKQYFLPQPGNEVALYHHFLTDVTDMKNLVTYNGKAFDWPQVRTRHTLVKDRVPKLPPFGHFDLLHASRRLWKHKLESVRLSIVEEHILDVHREEDTPGYLAPMLYFEYIKEQDPDIIEGIFQHNELDILSLILLYIHLSNFVLNPKSSDLSDVECFEIGRWFEAVNQESLAIECYNKVIHENGLHKHLARHYLASILKKQKQLDEAVTIWQEICSEVEDEFIEPKVLIELSKAFEHHYKDYDLAIYYAEKAYQNYKTSAKLTKKEMDDKKQFIHRIERLENKRSNS